MAQFTDIQPPVTLGFFQVEGETIPCLEIDMPTSHKSPYVFYWGNDLCTTAGVTFYKLSPREFLKWFGWTPLEQHLIRDPYPFEGYRLNPAIEPAHMGIYQRQTGILYRDKPTDY